MSDFEYVNGMPFYWESENTGLLEPAILKYLGLSPERKPLGKPPVMGEEDIALVRRYIQQWISAPCYRKNPAATRDDLQALAGLIVLASRIKSRKDVTEWLELAIAIGIDPM